LKRLRDRDLVNQVVVQSFEWNFPKDSPQLKSRRILVATGLPALRGG